MKTYKIDGDTITFKDKLTNQIVSYTREELLDSKDNYKKLSHLIDNTKLFGSQFETIHDTSTLKILKFETLLAIDKDVNFFLKLERSECIDLLIKNDDINKSVTLNHLENIKNMVEQNIYGDVNYTINVNISDIENDKLIQFLNDNPEVGKRIEFELLENISNSYLSNKNNSKLSKFFETIENVSAQINIDDFGSAESNIERFNILLDRIPNNFKSIKLDKEIVKYMKVQTLSDLNELERDEKELLNKIFRKKSDELTFEEIEKFKNFNLIFSNDITIKDLSHEEILSNFRSFKKSIKNKESIEILNRYIKKYIYKKLNITKKEYSILFKKFKELQKTNGMEITAEYIADKSYLVGISLFQDVIGSFQGYYLQKERLQITENQPLSKERALKIKEINNLDINYKLLEIEKETIKIMKEVKILLLEKKIEITETAELLNIILNNMSITDFSNNDIMSSKINHFFLSKGKINQEIRDLNTFYLKEHLKQELDKIDIEYGY